MISDRNNDDWRARDKILTRIFLYIFPFAHFSTSLFISARCCCWSESSVFRKGFKFPLQRKKVLIWRMIQFNDEWHPPSFSHHLHELSPRVWHFHLNDFGRSGKVYVSLFLFGCFSDSLSEKLTVSPMKTDYSCIKSRASTWTPNQKVLMKFSMFEMNECTKNFILSARNFSRDNQKSFHRSTSHILVWFSKTEGTSSCRRRELFSTWKRCENGFVKWMKKCGEFLTCVGSCT